ncbi:MAG TPA: hypothetical protein ENI86_12170 [Acidimicrobiales bacterium]|nr:hypothetical protein [Acidimicrobiales bacterium]
MRTDDVDVFSILTGIVFIGLGLWFVLEDTGLARLDFAVVWPLLVVGAGLSVLVVGVSRWSGR